MKLISNAFISIVMLTLLGWVLISLYGPFTSLAKSLSQEAPSFSINIPLQPFLVFILAGAISAWHFTRQAGKGKKAAILPHSLNESDERNQQITAKACRNAYIAMWYACPIAAILMLLYPFIDKTIPYYPIIIILLIPLTLTIIYLKTIKKEY
ncbi:hypothetical protein [Bacillus testis]|uniref:hypothetical protein n=1 Tax=Bacillus testis TaxID=1622072 RepID=UPI00067F6F69|nr:hypothetical protein [Bacillus testis]